MTEGKARFGGLFLLRARPCPYARRMDAHLLWYLLAGALILAGLAGTILPALPGLPLVFAGMLLAAWADGFRQIGVWTVALLAVLTAVSIVVDLAATALGAKRVGAGKGAMFGAALGTLVGAFFSIPGLILGPFLGAMIAELLRGRALAHASRIGFGTWVGLAVGTALKVALAFAMLGIFVVALLF
jgi:uncharacterized protein YqgC (DUF456 family)